MRHWSPWILLALASCTPEVVTLKLKVFPDKSGEITYLRLSADEFKKNDQPEKDGVFKGVASKRAEMRVTLLEGTFEKIDELNLGGIKCEFDSGKDEYTARIRIPTTATSEWYQQLGITQKQRDVMIRLFADVDSEHEAKPQLFEEFTKEMKVLFRVSMPGEVKSSKLDGPAWKVKIGDVERAAIGSGLPEDANSTDLFIPLDALFEGKTKEVTWTIVSGPILPEVQIEWDKGLHTRAKVDENDRKCEERLKLLHVDLQNNSSSENSTGKKFFENVKDRTLLVCPSTSASYRGPAEYFDEWHGDEFAVCDAEGNHPDGVHVMTRNGKVHWLRKGTETYRKALEQTKE